MCLPTPEAAEPRGIAPEADLGNVLRSAWSHRLLLLAAAAAFSVPASVVAHMRYWPTWEGEIRFAVGQVQPIGRLQDVTELAHQLASRRQVLTLAGLGDCISVPGAALGSDCPARFSVRGFVSERTEIVVFEVVAASRASVEQILDRAAAAVLSEHRALYDEAHRHNVREIAGLEQLHGQAQLALAHIEAQAGSGKPAAAASGSEPALVAELMRVGEQIGRLRQQTLAAISYPTRIVYGPEIAGKPPKVGWAAAGLLGAMTGLALAGLFLSLRRATKRA